MVFQSLDDAGNRRRLLTNRHVDTDTILPLLIDNRIDSDCRFTNSAVADNQFALTTTNRNKSVDSFQARLQRFMNRFSVSNARSFELNWTRLVSLNRSLAVNRASKSVNDTPNHVFANGNLHNSAGAFYCRALFDFVIATENNRADVILLKVKNQSKNIVAEVEQLARHSLIKPVNVRYAVANLNDRADFVNIQIDVVILNLVFNYRSDFIRIYLHV